MSTRELISRFGQWLRSYLAVASTTAVTFLVAFAADRNVEVDPLWLQTVLVGAIGILVLLVERSLVWLAERYQPLRMLGPLVTAIRLGNPLPSYRSEDDVIEAFAVELHELANPTPEV